jgi:hypothetical protein
VKRAENKDIARLMFASITRPINAALAGAGTLFAVAGLAHPVSALGMAGVAMLVATAGSVGRDLYNKDFVQEVLTEGPTQRALPEIPDSLAGQYRLQCLAAKRHYEKTIEAMDAAGPEMAEELFEMRQQVMEMVETIYTLAHKAHRIDGSLASQSRNEILKEIEKIKAQLVLTSDPTSRKHLERTREQKEEQLLTYDELALQVKRIQAQMQSINASLDNVQLKVIKISSADLKNGATDEITQGLQKLLAEVRLFEKSLDSTYAGDSPLPALDSLESWDERAEKRNRLPPAPLGTPELE